MLRLLQHVPGCRAACALQRARADTRACVHKRKAGILRRARGARRLTYDGRRVERHRICKRSVAAFSDKRVTHARASTRLRSRETGRRTDCSSRAAPCRRAALQRAWPTMHAQPRSAFGQAGRPPRRARGRRRAGCSVHACAARARAPRGGGVKREARQGRARSEPAAAT
jgi:hypothetical protein